MVFMTPASLGILVPLCAMSKRSPPWCGSEDWFDILITWNLGFRGGLKGVWSGSLETVLVRYEEDVVGSAFNYE